MRALLALALSLLPLALPAQAPAQEPTQVPAAEEAWLLLVGGKRAGIQRQSARVLPDGTYRTEVNARMAISRYSKTITILQRVIWIEAELLRSVEVETDLNGQRESLSARLAEEEILLVQERQGGRSERRIPAAGEVLGPRGVSERMRHALARSEPEMTFQRFLPETAALESVHLTLRGTGELRDSQGGLHRGQLVEEESSAFPLIITRSIYDEEGEPLYSVTEVGLKMEQVRIDAQQAGGWGTGGSGTSAPDQAFELELFDVASLAIPVRWPAGGPPLLSRLTAVTVRFTGAAVPELERAVRAALADLGGCGYRLAGGGEGLTVTIEREEAPPAWAPPSGEPVNGEYTGEGFYLDLADPRLPDLLSRCPARDPACLEALVFSYIRTKSLDYGFSGVADILSSRSGDCTEHAVLLAALLRKAGLPARIAYGFLLTEAGFIGHAWTEAYDGTRWHWLDASFPGGRPYRFRLRLGVLDPALPVWQQMGLSLFSVAGTVRAELLEAVDER